MTSANVAWSRFAAKNITMLLIASGFFPATRGRAETDYLESTQIEYTIAGVVVGPVQDSIQGATVALIDKTTAIKRCAITGANGSFSFTIGMADFDLQISAPGFVTRSVHESLRSDSHSDLGAIALKMEAEATEVIVTVTDKELAEEQVKVETEQRILGIVPNFLVTYDSKAVPLAAKQKYELAFKTLIDPETIGFSLASTGLQQKGSGGAGYGTVPAGYGKRLAASYGTASLDTILGSAVLPSLFHQDPRYFYKGTGGVRRRSLYAIGMSVACKGDNGRWQYNYSGLLGGLAAGGISNFYAPSASRYRFAPTVENTAIGVGSSAISNLLQEFLIRKLTPGAKHSPKP